VFLIFIYNIYGVMVSVLVPSAVYRVFEPRSGQTAKNTTLRRRGKDWFAWNENTMSCPSGTVSYPRTVVSVS
jgi:hypothetical protein